MTYLYLDTRAINRRSHYSKIIFWDLDAATIQMRLQFKKYFFIT